MHCAVRQLGLRVGGRSSYVMINRRHLRWATECAPRWACLLDALENGRQRRALQRGEAGRGLLQTLLRFGTLPCISSTTHDLNAFLKTDRVKGIRICFLRGSYLYKCLP